MFIIITITKTEAETIRKRHPETPITVMNRQSSHKKYCVEESYKILRLIQKMRNSAVKYTYMGNANGSV